METNEETTEQTQPSIGIYPAPNGLVLEIDDGSGKEPHRLVLEPDDASRIAVNIISNIVLFNLNQSMKMAMERAEADRLRQMILQGKDTPNFDAFKTR